LVSPCEKNIVFPAIYDTLFFLEKIPPKLPYVLTPEDVLLGK